MHGGGGSTPRRSLSPCAARPVARRQVDDGAGRSATCAAAMEREDARARARLARRGVASAAWRGSPTRARRSRPAAAPWCCMNGWVRSSASPRRASPRASVEEATATLLESRAAPRMLAEIFASDGVEAACSPRQVVERSSPRLRSLRAPAAAGRRRRRVRCAASCRCPNWSSWSATPTLPRLTQFFVAANHHHTTDEAVDEGDSASQLTYSSSSASSAASATARRRSAASGATRHLGGRPRDQRRESASREMQRPFEDVLDTLARAMPRARSEEGEEEELRAPRRRCTAAARLARRRRVALRVAPAAVSPSSPAAALDGSPGWVELRPTTSGELRRPRALSWHLRRGAAASPCWHWRSRRVSSIA